MSHTAKIELANHDELVLANAGIMDPEDALRINVEDALVDTDATRFGLPISLIEKLGLTPFLNENGQQSTASQTCLFIHRYNLRYWHVKEAPPSWAYLKARLSSLDISY